MRTRATFIRMLFRLTIILCAVVIPVFATEAAIAQPVVQEKTIAYSNRPQGVFFRYPARFVLREGDLSNTDDVGLGYMGPLRMGFVQQGGIRIATVEIPADSYPKSDLVNAFLSVSVHEHMTAGQCEQFASVHDSPRTKKLNINGVTFLAIDDGGAAAGHQLGTTYYHALVGGRCYELSYGVATAGCGAIDGITCVDVQAIMARLETMALSVRITPRAHSAAPDAKGKASALRSPR